MIYNLGAEPTMYQLKIYSYLIEYVLIEECTPSPTGISLGKGEKSNLYPFRPGN